MLFPVVAWLSLSPDAVSPAADALLDLSGAQVVFPEEASGREKKAVAMLVDEVAKRTRVRWQTTNQWPTDPSPTSPPSPVILVGRAAALEPLVRTSAAKPIVDGAPKQPEAYRLHAMRGAAPLVVVAASDARGVLFGVGHLLRSLRMRRGSVAVPSGLDVNSAPRVPLRGHQLGYRPKTNSYDGWTLALWEQYIRDLSVFGANAVELVPPRTDDAADSPHFPLPQIEMMEAMSRMIDEYGLDVWIWYPAMDRDYADPQTVESALAEWGEVFRRLVRIDALFVPGGDPGHTRPKVLMALLEKAAGVLHRYHPRAQLWVSPQSFSREWMDEFLAILREAQPAWLSGVVFGPQVRGSLAQFRAAVPANYPIRHYPDITHSRQCQYPVPEWDVAYAVTEGREVINPRPLGQARIFRLLQEHTAGYITYSEGCNDDVNKVVWSALGWNPEASVLDILREYSRYFLGEDYTESFAHGLLALERNWQGPLIAKAGVYTTLLEFQSMERAASPADLLNWRFQQALYRAYYDAYTQSRLLHETALEDEAMAVLREARRLGSLLAVSRADAVLERTLTERVAADWRARIFELAEALYQSIRMQLSVERYKAIRVDRGANLDSIDVPLNNYRWLKQDFSRIRALAEEADRLKAIDRILDWSNPGPGGFYDDLGDPLRQPHLASGPGFEKDPAFLESALVGFSSRLDGPRSWWSHAEALQDSPLRMRYTGLDPGSRYKVRVVYGGDSPATRIRLIAGDGIEVHPLLRKPLPVEPIEFEIPPEATLKGELDLTWYREPGLGGNGRGCQVSEVWLIPQ